MSFTYAVYRKNRKKIVAPTCNWTLLFLSITIALTMSMSLFSFNVNAATDLPTEIVTQEEMQLDGEGKLIEITPYTNIEELPNIDRTSDVYRDLKLSQASMAKTRISVGHVVSSKATNVNKDTLRVTTQNIGVDTLDLARITVRMYNGGLHRLTASRDERSILPMFWRTNDFYCSGYTHAQITVYVSDAGQSDTTVFYYYR